MKTQLIALTLFAGTAAAVALYPETKPTPKPVPKPTPVITVPTDPQANEKPVIDAVFVLDTTGSMGGLIQAAKEKIWSIASTMASAQPTPELRLGLVAFRDRGDAYVTRVVDLSTDLDQVYATLMDFEAAGGGDGPESVNAALDDAVTKMSWSQADNAYKVVFLVGDAPPHMDYQDEKQYPEILAAATANGIVINAIQCGSNGHTAREWARIAQLGAGQYFQVDQAGSAVAVATPFDERIAELSAELDRTRLYYGSEEDKAKAAKKVEAAEKVHASAPVASRARRAAFNASEGGKRNFLGDSELVDDLTSGRVDLDALPATALPEPMQAMEPEEQEAFVQETAQRRQELQRQIADLAEERSSYLKKEAEKADGFADSLDAKLYGAVREQAAAKGLEYAEEEPDY